MTNSQLAGAPLTPTNLVRYCPGGPAWAETGLEASFLPFGVQAGPVVQTPDSQPARKAADKEPAACSSPRSGRPPRTAALPRGLSSGTPCARHAVREARPGAAAVRQNRVPRTPRCRLLSGLFPAEQRLGETLGYRPVSRGAAAPVATVPGYAQTKLATKEIEFEIQLCRHTSLLASAQEPHVLDTSGTERLTRSGPRKPRRCLSSLRVLTWKTREQLSAHFRA